MAATGNSTSRSAKISAGFAGGMETNFQQATTDRFEPAQAREDRQVRGKEQSPGWLLGRRLHGKSHYKQVNYRTIAPGARQIRKGSKVRLSSKSRSPDFCRKMPAV